MKVIASFFFSFNFCTRKREKKRKVLKCLNSMIFSVTDKNIPVWCDSHSFHSFEFTISTSPSTKWMEISAVGIKDLDAVVPRIPWSATKNVYRKKKKTKRKTSSEKKYEQYFIILYIKKIDKGCWQQSSTSTWYGAWVPIKEMWHNTCL